MNKLYLTLASAASIAVITSLALPNISSAQVSLAFPPETVLIWAGDKAHVAPDFVAVVDFDQFSPSYGKVLKTVPLPSSLPTQAGGGSTGATGNEPHHVGVSADGKTLVLGGLLSVLRGQDQVFFYDISDPRKPRFIKGDNPGFNPLTGSPAASIADEAKPLSKGGFLVTFMGGSNGAAPGRVVEYDANNNYVNAWPQTPPQSGFNPHGIAIDEANNLMLTSDFICPLHTLYGLGFTPGADFRGSVSVWDLEKREITNVITIGNPYQPAGTINVEFIPNDPKLRAFVSGAADGNLYLVDPKQGTAQAVFNFGADPAFQVANASVTPHLFRMNSAGTRLYITLNYNAKAGKVVELDIGDPLHPVVRSFVDLGPNSGPHYLALSADEHRLIVSDYFLNEDLTPPGVVGVEGDLKVHVINVSDLGLRIDPRFDLDFSRDIATGPAQPHGMALVSDPVHSW